MVNNESSEKNLLVVLSSRRVQNFKSQFKSVVLEGLEIFGKDVVEEVYKDCLNIYDEYLAITKSVNNE